MRIKRSIVTVAPAIEPVPMNDVVKLDLKLDSGTTEDELLHIWIQAAREAIEERTGLSLITQTRRIKLDYFPRCNFIELTYGPVQSVVVKYYDDNETEQTLSSSDYWLDTHGNIARIVIKDTWPSTYSERPNAVDITYVAGFGHEAPDVPYPLRSAILLRIANLYENRASVQAGSFNEVPLGEDILIAPYIVTQDVGY